MTIRIGIRELSEMMGIAPHTLRYYEDAGLMIAVPRDDAGRRVYDGEHVRWVSFLLRLREGGMGIAEVRDYVDLITSGTDPSGARRTAILRAHRDDVKRKIQRLRAHLAVLDRKVADGCGPDHTDHPTEGEDLE